MLGSLISLLMGLAVGIVYGLVQVRSPAPPLIALVGLLGMVMGEQAVDMARRHFTPPAQASSLMREGSADGPAQLSRRD
jgi:XapX domain-containing protein